MWRVSAIDAVEQLLRREPEAAHAIASVDSAVRLGLLPTDRLDELFERLPRRLRRLRRDVNGLADSGVESLLRLAVAAGLAFIYVPLVVIVISIIPEGGTTSMHAESFCDVATPLMRFSWMRATSAASTAMATQRG